jgi:GT2 family glycosyltransferase
VVVPVRNGGRNFERCLQRLRDSHFTDFELIVVDDGSRDDSASRARDAGAMVIRRTSREGPAAARNLGAQAAQAPLVFFLDADVAVHPQTLGLALARFAADPQLSALFGSYDDDPPAPGIVSQYRNLLHHFVHQQGHFDQGIRPAHTFWTGCGAIRRDVFVEFGGFDPRLYPRPAIEDIELGYRLTQAGHCIVLARDVLGTHLKRWSLREMITTDILRRGVPWTLLMKRTGRLESDLNVKASQKACVGLTALALLGGMLSLWLPWTGILAGCCLAGILLLNRSFFRFLQRRKGMTFACAAIPLHLLYYCCCGCSVVIALLYWHSAHRLPRAGTAGHARTDSAAAPVWRRAKPRRAWRAAHARTAPK